MCLVMGDNPVYKGTIKVYKNQKNPPQNLCPHSIYNFLFFPRLFFLN